MIAGQQIRLRAIEEQDQPLLLAWRNDPQVYRHFFEHEPTSLAMQERWFARFLERGDEKFWIAETLADPRPVGTIALVGIDWRSRHAEMGRILVYPPDARGAGVGREMCRLALEYGFAHLNLNRIFCEVFADNAPAIALYRRLGFREEGRLRSHVFAEGRYRDVLVFGLLREESAA